MLRLQTVSERWYIHRLQHVFIRKDEILRVFGFSLSGELSTYSGLRKVGVSSKKFQGLSRV
jgi:hypothetical protein